LDPEQNNTFTDHYLEIPFDLSKVMFITTANSVYNIPRPLLDRMEVIELSSYTEEDKMPIAMDYLIPKQIKEHGLKRKNIQFSEDAVRKIIGIYPELEGRNLERRLLPFAASRPK
jgi:ATP-dependent Lon protease